MPASSTTSLLYVNLSKNSFFNAHEYLILESECKGKEIINTNQIFWEKSCKKTIVLTVVNAKWQLYEIYTLLYYI